LLLARFGRDEIPHFKCDYSDKAEESLEKRMEINIIVVYGGLSLEIREEV